MPACAMVEVKPRTAPQNTPLAALGRPGGGTRAEPDIEHEATPITPMISRTTSSGT